MNDNNLPYADEMPYWKTSKSGVESWLDKTENLIESIEGVVDTRIAGKSGGREAIMFGFIIDGDNYKLVYPVLPVKNPKDKSAALRQCATLIYHDTKARVNRIRIFSPRVVFSDYLVLDSGRTISEMKDINIKSALGNIKLLN